MSLIELNGVTKDYRLGKTTIHALRGLSFSVDSGDFIVIMGPSGCGKSTLLNIIGCIDKPSAGSVFLDGREAITVSDNDQADIRLQKIGFVFQSFNLVPVLSVRENIEFPLVLAKVPKKIRADRVSELIELVGLRDYGEHKPDELSGGQRQRVAIARALVNKPRIVIADEPTANLDSENGNAILSVMRDLNRNEAVTFIFSTHNPETVAYAKRIIRLKDGLITEDRVTGNGE